MSKGTETRKTSTVKLQGGVEYAKVSTRLKEFHEDNSECSIACDVHFEKGGENTWVLVTATVECPRGRFVQHSMDTFKGKQKFLEKLETVAVGRALAVAGYMASGEIASFEEMDVYEASREREATKNVVIDRLSAEFARSVSKADFERLLGRVERMTTLDDADRDYLLDQINHKLAAN